MSKFKSKGSQAKTRNTKNTSDKAPAKFLPKKFPVVGIGASAGGLEAFTALLEALPVDTGMAFVFVQHLDPTHESLGPEILSRSSRMEVQQVKEGMRVQPNCVYLIPPNHSMVLSNYVLALQPRTLTRGQHLTIDSFFQSLAADQKGRAIGVLLSGAASDGTQGLRAIKGEGGLCIAQEPTTAKHGDMPKSAIAAGVIDLILPPAEIALELARIAKHPYIAAACESGSKTHTGSEVPDDGEKEDQDQTDVALRKIFAILRIYSKIDFSNYKHTTLKRRIHRRMMVRRTDTLEAYAKYLQEDNDEVKSLFNDILINVTEFFRDPESYKALIEQVFPQFINKRSIESPIRIWVAACATGEEAYSLAMALVEFLEESGAKFPIQIFATDISEPCLQKARAGIYSESNLGGVSKERLERFFEKVEGGYKIKKSLRQLCLFSRHDLSGDPAFGKLDLISCRNLLIYFAVVLQKRVIPVFHYALKSGGFLWLGKSEGTGTLSSLFTVLDKIHRLYSKANVQTPMTFRFPSRAYVPDVPELSSQAPMGNQNISDFDRLSDRIALSKYAPPSVLVNCDLEILQFRGDTGPYLQVPPGAPTNNLFKMVKPDLLLTLRTTIHEARVQNKQARHEGLAFDLNGNRRNVGIQVIPTNPLDAPNQRNLVVFFEEPAPVSILPQKKSGKEGTKAASKNKVRNEQENRISQLEQEASANKLYQQAMFEDFEATREELTAGNEELQSTNEELQSTNEELETAKEEVQSSNEELTTVNDELQNRNAELTMLMSDFSNILTSVDIPLLIVDGQRQIRRFTPLAAKVFNFIDGDIGRPLRDIRNTFDLDLDKLVSEVVESLVTLEKEIQDNKGHWMRLQIRPFKTIDNKIDGAVIACIDIHALKTESRNVRLFESIAVAANEATSVDAALHIFLEEICKHAQCSIGHAYLPAKDGSGKLISSKVWYLDDLKKFARYKEGTEPLMLAPGTGLPGKVVSTRSFVSSNDLDNVLIPQKARFAAEAGIKSALGFPVFVDNVIVAVLEFFSLDSAKPDPKLINIISHVTPQLSRVFERKRSDEVRDELLQSQLMVQKAIENERENFRNLFQQTPDMVCILSGPNHVFEFVNEAHVKALGFNATGMAVREAQPETVETHDVLDEVYRSGKNAEFFETPATVTGRLRYFNATYAARRDQSGQIDGVMFLGVEVTEQVEARKRIEEYATEQKTASQRTEAEKQKFEAIFYESPAIMALLRGPTFIYEIINPTYREIIGGRDVIGKTLIEALPEMVGQPFINVMKEVFETGTAFNSKEAFARLSRTPGGEPEDSYWDYTFFRVNDGQGKPYGIYIHGIDITEKVATRKHIEQLAKSLKESVHARDEFMSIASHELKTPITGMKIQTQMFKRAIKNSSPNAYEPKRVTEIIHNVDHGLDRMTRLVEDMLDISKIRLGKLDVECESTDITKLVAEIIDRLKPEFASAGISVHSKLTEGLRCNLDRFRFEQVLTNLATNAIRYAPHAPIEVELKREANHVVLRFRDHGPGVPHVDHENIFKRFERLVSADKSSGMGLGLYICREIVEAHGGSIRIDAETSPGTCFLLELPAEKGALP